MDETPAAVPPDPGPVSLDSAATSAGTNQPRIRLRDALSPGALLAGRYRIERLLARGGMGEVHEAHDQRLGVPVALKTLRHDLGGDPVQLRRFKRELMLARLITHPNVCQVYDLEVDRSTQRVLFFLTMELLSGETLWARVRARGRLSPGEALPLVQQMATALGAAHAAGVVHCDFKSANVMLVPAPDGERAVVTDFGLARLERGAGGAADEVADAARAGNLLGTPAYMAPEQVRGEPAGPPADIYALGVVLFEMVTGRLPFSGATATETARLRLKEAAPSPRALAADVDVVWERAILRCLAREPGERFASAEEVAAVLAGEQAADANLRHTLPAERDVFVGRSGALDQLAERLERGARLVTLVGPGGTGKTRLAVRHGWSTRRGFPGGVWFCDMTAARDINGIAAAVANALEVPLGKGDPIVQLGHAIASRGRTLFIFDNFEQVVEHSEATVGRWLERAPEARFVLTSRERLGLAAEEVQPLEPLDEEEGVGLFLARARTYRPGFGSKGGTEDRTALEEIRQVVRLIDGLPLAIELAAARVRVLDIGQIVAQLQDRFRLLVGGKAEGKHATLRATIDSSWELLRPWEKAAFAQCAVFEGGFTLEAAEEVLGLGPWPEAPWVVDVVQALVDKSLLRMWVPEGETGEPRFGMYVSLQEYARERLRETESWAPEASSTIGERLAEERHGRHYARFGTEEAIDALDLHVGREPRRRLAAELDNFVAACHRAITDRDGETAVRTFAAAWEVLDLQGPAATGVSLGQAVLAIAGLAPTARGRALCLSGTAHRRVGRTDAARGHLERALAIHREVGNRVLEGVVLGSLGSLYGEQGRMGEEREHLERALAIHREVGNRRFEGIILGDLGLPHCNQGRMEEGREHYERALAIHRELGNRRFEGAVLGNLGVLFHDQGLMEEAREHYEGALAIHRERGDRGYEGSVIGNLGTLHADQGRMEEAREHHERALAIHREVGNRRSEGIVLTNLGNLYYELGRTEEARAHYERALAVHREFGNRYGEGAVLGRMGVLNGDQGRMAEASALLAEGERLLRDGNRWELGLLLCARGEVELKSGRLAAARATLAEADSIAAALGAGPHSQLGRNVALLRLSVARAPDIPVPDPKPTPR